MLLPPRREQAKTSSANVLRSSPAQSSPGVRSFFGFVFAAASGAGLASCGFRSARVRELQLLRADGERHDDEPVDAAECAELSAVERLAFTRK